MKGLLKRICVFCIHFRTWNMYSHKALRGCFQSCIFGFMRLRLFSSWIGSLLVDSKPFLTSTPWKLSALIQVAPLPYSHLEMELKYYAIFKRYFDKLVTQHYQNDKIYEDRDGDLAVKDFYEELREVGIDLPPRHENLKTREGLTCFLADTVYMHTVLHEVYGTKHMFTFLDTRLMQFKYDKFNFPPKWEAYMSSVFVSLATSRAAFPKLMGADMSDVFQDLGSKGAKTACDAWKKLQHDLQDVSREYGNHGNVDALGRILPEDLELGVMY